MCCSAGLDDGEVQSLDKVAADVGIIASSSDSDFPLTLRRAAAMCRIVCAFVLPSPVTLLWRAESDAALWGNQMRRALLAEVESMMRKS